MKTKFHPALWTFSYSKSNPIGGEKRGKKDCVKGEEKETPKEEVGSGSVSVEEEKKDPQLLTLEDIREHIRTRRRLSSAILRKLVVGFYTTSAQKEKKEELLSYLGKEEEECGGMEVDEKAGTGSGVPKRGCKSGGALLPEVDIYLHLLVLLLLLNNAKEEEGGSQASLDSLIPCSAALIEKITAQNRRSLDPLAGKMLLLPLSTATLKNDIEGQAILINCLLRNYLHYNLYDQADKLVSKATFPDTASNNECARYLYYLGRIKTIQLEYSEAHKHLVQSLRKAPQYSVWGFRHTVEKLRITVELLLGDIPERQTFLLTKNKAALAPYFYLTQAVRSGDIKRFQDVLDNHTKLFQSDHTFTLILRLRNNVIRTAVRSISLAYSRISLEDVAQKLRLGSAVDAESVIAKAIRDGVIEATIDHENGWMQSKENSDIYCTREPQLAFHERIEFCLDLHNNSVKAMRFPPKSYNKDLESAEDRREREAQDLELAKEMAEEDDDII
ncbi:PSMD3 [Lepeophtheirus salmonis]|uniref:PSMD3 n=1 Tax=Lepeophtheirus salmonis TaxID=72036 RepID=A0A7R8CQI8_LEPSM|nr:PSMD3 [Lepeophtheirus salmonis]CAF2895870.1 PSMD3 [Lepeophtheirus salmonis]